MAFADILGNMYMGNTVNDYIIAASVFIVSVLLLKIFKQIVLIRLRKFSEKTETRLDDIVLAIVDVRWPFFVFVSLYISFRIITVPAVISRVVEYILLIVITYYVGKALQKLIEYMIHRKAEKEGGVREASSMLDALGVIAKITLWITAFLFIISNLGYNISTLLTGLGIGGIAIAFALQNVLADIFASISIYLDKPFVVGDFIMIGTDMGEVRKIGIKSTRLKTLQGEELIVSNKELTEARVNNFKKMERRRVVFSIGVTYDTSSKKLKDIPGIVKGIIDKIELADFDRAHFKSYGDSALTFEIVYYAGTSDYTAYMDIQQGINLQIKEAFEKKKIEMAFPTRTIYLNKQK